MKYSYIPLNSDPIVQRLCTKPSDCVWRRNKFRS